MFSFYRDKPMVLPGLTPVCVMASIPSRALCKFVSCLYTWQCLCEFIYIPVYIALHLDIVSVNVSVSFTNYVWHCHYKIVSLIYIWVISQCHSEIVSQLYNYIWRCLCELYLVCLSPLHLTLWICQSPLYLTFSSSISVCCQFKCFWCCFYVLFTCF